MKRVIVFHASTKGMVKQFDVCHYGGGRGVTGRKNGAHTQLDERSVKF